MNLPVDKIATIIQGGGLVVMPTDTIYGLVASACQPSAVERLVQVKQRPDHKPFIILISRLEDLAQFEITPTKNQLETLSAFWPGPVSVVLGQLAFRLPAPSWLRALISLTGPLAAPSANPHAQPAASTIAEARQYFGEQVDLYVDGGQITGQASKLVSLEPNGAIKVLRV